MKPKRSMTGTLTCAATSLKKFTLNGTTNVVFTLVKGNGGSFKASEVVVAGGVLQQGGDNVLGETPKITVQVGGTFDINGKTIRQETPIYIAGAGAGNWPWALATSSTDYLTVTKTLSGTLKVDISDPAVAGKAKIPLLKVPVALKDTADGAFDLTALPPGWQLQSKDDGVNVEYLIRNLGFSIFIR